MPIKFRCPNEGCGKPLTVSDQFAGRPGKCPGCGGPLVVPWPESATNAPPYDLELVPDSEPVTVPVARPRPESRVTPSPAPSPVKPVDDPDWAPVAAGGAVVSFEAVGLAWGLFSRQMGTWILAVLLVGLTQLGCQLVLFVLGGLGAAAEASTIGSPGLISMSAMVCALMVVQLALFGGLYKMALKQVDGGEIGVGDAFKAWGAAPGLAVAGILIGMGTAFGTLLFIIPGLVFAALSIFALPGVVDGLGAIEAIGRSVGTLKRQWFAATLFLVVIYGILSVGSVAFGVGLLFTVPLFVLAVSVQYRRSFAPGGVPRKVAVADPWAEAVGRPSQATGSGRVPAWAWGVVGVGVVLPLAMVALMAALVLPAALQGARQAALRQQQASRERIMTKGQGDFQGGMMPSTADGPGMAPPGASADLVEQALDTSAKRPDGRPIDVGMLYTLPADDRHRPAVMAALKPLLADPEAGGDAARAMEVWAGPGDVPTLLEGLESDQPRVRMFLFRALRRLKPEAAIPALVEHMGRPEDRGEASLALQAIGPKAAPELLKLLSADDRDTRREAVKVLKAIAGNDPGMKRTLSLAVAKGPDVFERDRALDDLARLKPAEDARDEVLAAVLPLLKAAESSTRAGAIKVVEAWGTAEQVPALVEMLDDGDRNVKVRALAALRKFPDKSAALAIARLLGANAVRREAVDALVAMKPKAEEVEAEVLKILESPDAPARVAACQVLKAIGTEASVPALKKAAGDPQRNVANAARAALAAIDPSAQPDAPADTPKKTMTKKKR